MNHLSIANLDFCEPATTLNSHISGGYRSRGFLDVAYDAAFDTSFDAKLSLSGDPLRGYTINRFSRDSSAGAGASATAYGGGRAQAIAMAEA